MITVGLTGGIGSGKSTVAGFFEALGVPVYNSDLEARKLMKTSKLKKAIKALLGSKAYQRDDLNKPYIAEKIFNDKNLLAKLNGIVHPAVRDHFLEWKNKQDASYVIQESALIFENNSESFYDKIILVTAPISDRLQRIMRRDEINQSQVEDRFKNQLTDEEKLEKADFIINNVLLAETENKVLKLHKVLLDYTE